MADSNPKKIVTAQDYFDAHNLSADKIAVLNYWGLDKHDIGAGLRHELAAYYDDAAALLTVTRDTIERYLPRYTYLQKLDEARNNKAIVLLDDLLAMTPEEATTWIAAIEQRMEEQYPDWRVSTGLKEDKRIGAAAVQNMAENKVSVEMPVQPSEKTEAETRNDNAVMATENNPVEIEKPAEPAEHLTKIEKHAEKNGVSHKQLDVLKMIKLSDAYQEQGYSKLQYLSGNARDKLEDYGIKNAYDVLNYYHTAPLKHWGSAMDRDFSKWRNVVGLVPEYEFLKMDKGGIENFILTATDYVSQRKPDWQNQLLREEQAVTAKTTQEYAENLNVAPGAMDYLRVFMANAPYSIPDTNRKATLPNDLIRNLARKNIHSAYDIAKFSSSELAYYITNSENEMRYLQEWISSVHGVLRVDNYDTKHWHPGLKDSRVPYESLNIPNFKQLQHDAAAYLATGQEKARLLYPDLDDRIAMQKALDAKAPKGQIGQLIGLVTPYIRQKQAAKIEAQDKAIEQQLREEDEARYQARQRELTDNNKKDWVNQKLQKMAIDNKDKLSRALRDSKITQLANLSGQKLKSGHVMLIVADVVMAQENEVKSNVPYSYTYGSVNFEAVTNALNNMGLSVDMPTKFADAYDKMISDEIEEAQEATRIEENRQKFAEQFNLNYKRVCMKDEDIKFYHARMPTQLPQEGQQPKSVLFGLQ